jgi:hypothetical protein
VGAGKEVDVRLCHSGQPEISSDPRAAQDGADTGIKKKRRLTGEFSGQAAMPLGRGHGCVRICLGKCVRFFSRIVFQKGRNRWNARSAGPPIDRGYFRMSFQIDNGQNTIRYFGRQI